ncbi:twin-arginine translocase subunit TatC [Dissulfurimicrobium hydrothermale]|uniref:twin-arginine translocase subunit TatC n=1 Tax=Dissulfurimicrobium hydrothermale TaxID=1750598 RepID=UPI001EDA91ED|nr:twin-arginine translocase subunit TatC [Dissulfurimicrobium hydrothermale]UKL13870.1 twin-arginine translocase subunit TatC [Dissulfurimicrobium hydrothermale]
MTDKDQGRHNPFKELSLTEHLAELRRRIVVSLIAVAICSTLSYAFIEPIFAVLARPIEAVLPPGTSLIFTSYPEAFFIYIKLAITCGVFLASPIIIYEIWAFVVPGLYEHEKRLALPFVLLSTAFFVGGGLFGYFVAFPTAFKFLASYGNKYLRLMPNVSEYFSLTIHLLIGFGIAFELPVFIALLGVVGIIDAKMLQRNRKYAILINFILAAVLTPTPDILNQFMLAVPLMLLYEISIVLVWLIGKRGR